MKQIRIGIESFEKIIDGGYFYVDKTLFIKELLENMGEVTLITRPRRFGKTLNMNMLKCFFDIRSPSPAPSSNDRIRRLFKGLKIMEHGGIVEEHMGKHPVVFLTLREVEEPSYDGSIEVIRRLVSELYERNLYIYESGKLGERQKSVFYSLYMGSATDTQLKSALQFLTSCLHAYYGKRAVVLVDEYDAPINTAYLKGYYPEMIEFMRGFMGSVFKSNPFLEFGVLTGILRISKEGMMSSFNNPFVRGVMDKEFAECFGFTEDEVKDACRAYGLADNYDVVKKWYNGYRFGGRDMYNPWSITSYLIDKEIGPYWVNTASTELFADVFHKGDDSLRESLAGLITGATVDMSLRDEITYPIDYSNSDALWTLLLYAGYIKPCNGAKKSRFAAELVNLEISELFADRAKEWLGKMQPTISKAIQGFAGCLLRGDEEGVRRALNDDLLNNPSCYDYKEENSYHMFIFGMLLALSEGYTVHSNPESGKGRSDCLIMPVEKNEPAVVIEFKHRCEDGADLRAAAEEGLRQIEEKAYVHSLKQEGYAKIYKYSIAFHKKNCEIAMGIE